MIPDRRADAIAYVDDRRTETWLGYPDMICGILVDQLSLYHLVLLTDFNNSFFCGGVVTDKDVSQFLWCIKHDKPKYFLRIRKWLFGFKIRRLLRKCGSELRSEIEEYLEVSTMDAPPSRPSQGQPFTGWLASYIDYMSQRHGWTVEQTIHAPLRQLYQLLRIMYKEHNPEMAMPNGLLLGKK